MSESLYGALIVAVLLAAYAYLDARTVRRAAVLGALIALAALTRGEALLLVPLLGLALVARGSAAGDASGSCTSPCSWRPSRSCSPRGRSATRRRSPRPSSSPPTARASGSAPTAIRPTTGRSSACGTSRATGRRRPGDEAQQSREYRRRGMQYMRDHAGRVPLVLAARVGRLYDVFRPAQMRVYEASEGRPARSERLGVWLFWLLAPSRRRRGVAAAPPPPAARHPARPGGHGHAHRAADLRLHALSLRGRAVDRRARGGGRRRASCRRRSAA